MINNDATKSTCMLDQLILSFKFTSSHAHNHKKKNNIQLYMSNTLLTSDSVITQ